MSNGNVGRDGWKLVCTPGEAMKRRLELAMLAESKARGCPAASVTYQLMVPTLLHEAMDARGIPRVDDGGTDAGE
jgi:hypothetical protein